MLLPVFGIVTFQRPEKLVRLVNSIRAKYPAARIVIADNGRKLPARPAELAAELEGCQTVVLPFDCGLSAARNFLISHTGAMSGRPDLVILDDDYLFTDSTSIERMQAVLAADSKVGIVCGRVQLARPSDLEHDPAKPGTLRCVPCKRPMQTTPGGVEYQICDFAENFLLMRRACLDSGVRWNPGLKIGEHLDFFLQVHRANHWRVAFVPSSIVDHDQATNSSTYVAFRQRAGEFREILRREAATVPPSIVVMGAGHTGTRVLVQMLKALGWHTGAVKESVAENLAVQDVNKAILARSGICPCGSDQTELADGKLSCRRCGQETQLREVPPAEIQHAIDALPRPWVIKDPRMVLTLDAWMPALAPYKPLLVHLERNLDRVRKTYEKHGWSDFRIYGEDVPNLVRKAAWHKTTWPFGKISLHYEQLAEAVRSFDLSRAT